MIEAAITWIGFVCALGVGCKTLLELAKLYYRDQEKTRLERLDRQVQVDARLAEINQENVLEKIVELANTKYYPYQIGEGVIAEFKAQGLMSN